MQQSVLRLATSNAHGFSCLSSLRLRGAPTAVFVPGGLASQRTGRALRLRCFATQSTAAMDAIKKLMKDPELFKTQSLIGGKWANAADGDTVDVRSTRPL